MIVYKIYLGSPHDVDKAVSIISDKFDNFTLYKAIGHFQKTEEKTLVFEIIGKEDYLSVIKAVCVVLRNTFNQNCVMFTHYTTNVEFI